MTRLTEAMQRAVRESADTSPLPEPAAKSGDEVLRTWHLDAECVQSPPRPGAATQPEPVAKRPFPEDLTDKVVLGDRVDARMVEQCRRIAAMLHHAQTQRGVRSIMVASAVAAEGKTLTATNVALTLSHSFDRRVLLIDADLRRPSLHEMFSLSNDHGLVDSLRSHGGGRLPVQPVSRNLWVLTAGHPTSDPMSALVSSMMKQLLADAMEQFDWIIADTPPVALMPDANLLAGMIDAALLVIRAGATPYPLAQRAAAAIGPEKILGVVLNRADGALTDEYGYYSGYHRAPRHAAARQPRRGSAAP